jgi:hypothetical protein
VREGRRLERWVEVALGAGVAASGACLLLGLATDRDSVLRAGILILMLTPVVRVLVLTIGLFEAGDRRFGFVSLAVLVVLLAGIVLARG